MPKALKLALPLIALALVIVGATLAMRSLSRDDPALSAATTSPPATVAPATEATAGSQPTTQEEAPQYIKATDFTAYTAQGEAVKLSDFFGKPIVLNLWASWCGPCQYEMPDFQAVYDELGQDVAFIMLNMTDGDSETAETALSFISEGGYTFPVYLDSDMAGAYAYSATSIPRTFIFDSNGYLAGYQLSMLSEEGLRAGIDMALEQAPLTAQLD